MYFFRTIGFWLCPLILGISFSAGIVVRVEFPTVQHQSSEKQTALGRFPSSLDNRGRLEEFVYDNLDQVIEQRITDTNGASNTSSAPVTIHFAYYANGVLQSRRIEGSNIETTYAIDAFNRVTGVSYGISGQGGQFGTSAVYDAVGNVISTTDMRAVTRVVDYDDLNRPTWVRIPGGQGPFNGDGTVSRATYDLVGNKLTERDMHGNQTEFVYDGLYRLRRKLWPTVPGGGPYRETFLYDPRGNLTRYTDANNHSTEYAHDGLSRRTLVTDAAGRVMQYEYAANDASSNPSVERNVTNGLEIRREYDGLYRVTREETRLPNVQGGGGTLAYVRTVAYNDTANTVEETDARGFVRFTQMDAFGRMYKTVRDVTGLALTTYAHYDERGNRISTTDPAGTEDNDSNHTTTWTYDILNRMTSATYPTGITESWVRDGEGLPTEHLDLNGVRTRFTYDNLQRPLTTTMEQPISAGLSCPKIQGDVQLSSVTYFDADPLGLPNANYAVATDDAVGRKTYQGFDAAGRLLAVRDGVGTADERERVMTYDGAVMLTTTDWRAVGAPGNVTSFQYDVVNRVTRAVDPFGKNVVTQYQDGTVRVVMTDKRGIVETRQLDALGRMVSVTRTGTDATTITPVRNQYDAHSNLIETRDGVGNATRFQYDGADRQTATIRGAGSPSAATITTTYDKLGNALTVDNAHLSMAYAYDALSRRTSATDGVGRTTTYGYDNLGRMTQSTDPYNNTAAYAYDELGALISVQSPAGNVQYRYDAGRRRVLDLRSDKTVERTYDILGRMTGMNEYEPGCPEDGGGGQSRTAGASSPNGAKFDSPGQASARRPGNGADAAKFGLFNPNATPVTTQTWEYNRNDSLTRLVDAKGQTVEYDYDALQRLERKRYPFAADGGFGPVVKEFAYTYNDNNLPINVTELRVDNSTVQYLMAYDGLDRLRSETDGFGKTTQFSYLDNGLRASMIDPLGATVAYDYDELNRLKQVSSPYGGAQYQYFSDDLLQKMSFPDATSPKVTCDYGYDNAGRVTSVTNKNAPANSVISSYGLAYNDATNQITLNEQNLIGGNPATETSVFSFSQGNRLTTADYQTRGYQVSYTYNSAGYRTTETATGTTAYSRNYSYGQLGRLSSVAQTGGGNAGTTTFGWDANGNLTTKTYSPESGAPQTTTFTYDIRDNLRKVVNPAGQTAGLYQYDHAARRVRQETAAGVLHSTFDGDQILTEWNGTMANVAAYVSGRGQLVARSEAGPTRTNYAMVMNHLGSTANVVNVTAAPTVSASYRYDAWGMLRQETPIGQNNNRRTFTGQQWDEESGLYCFGNGTRFMDADLGMFLQDDPVYGDIKNPSSLNPYVYAWSNPIWYTDPSGETVVLSSNDAASARQAIANKNKDAYIQLGKVVEGGKGRTATDDEQKSLRLADRSKQLILTDKKGAPTALGAQIQDSEADTPVVITENGDSVNQVIEALAGSNVSQKDRDVLIQGAIAKGIFRRDENDTLHVVPGKAVTAGQVRSAGIKAAGEEGRANAINEGIERGRQTQAVADELVDLVTEVPGGVAGVIVTQVGSLAVSGEFASVDESVEGYRTGAQVTAVGKVVRNAARAVKNAAGAVNAADDVADVAASGKNGKSKADVVRQNKAQGTARENSVLEELQQEHPDAEVLKERYLRDSQGKRITDPETGEARRVDFAVVQDGEVKEIVEVTSPTAPKADQLEKTQRIRQVGDEKDGTYIKRPRQKELIPVPPGAPETVRRRP